LSAVTVIATKLNSSTNCSQRNHATLSIGLSEKIGFQLRSALTTYEQCCTTRSEFVAERIVNVRNTVPHNVVDCSTVAAFKRFVENV